MNKLKIEDFDQEKLKKKNLVVNGELSEKFYNVYKIYYNCNVFQSFPQVVDKVVHIINSNTYILVF